MGYFGINSRVSRFGTPAIQIDNKISNNHATKMSHSLSKNQNAHFQNIVTKLKKSCHALVNIIPQSLDDKILVVQ